MATVIIPTPLRKFTNNASRVSVNATTVKELVNDLSLNFPELKKHLQDETSVRSSTSLLVTMISATCSRKIQRSAMIPW